MKFLFKKWQDFEGVHGTSQTEAEVKQAAIKYLQVCLRLLQASNSLTFDGCLTNILVYFFIIIPN